MRSINIINSDAETVNNIKTDVIVTDPPFEMTALKLNNVLNTVKCDHLVLITTMRQLIDLIKISKWELSFDFVLDAVVPKKSMSIHQPNYIHATGVYLIKNKSKSIFNRKLRNRSDTFDGKGYWPTIIKSERNRMSDDGFAKNIRAMVDIIGSFDVSNVYDPFAGSGTTGFASIELGIECTLVEIDALKFSELKKKFNFFL